MLIIIEKKILKKNSKNFNKSFQVIQIKFKKI